MILVLDSKTHRMPAPVGDLSPFARDLGTEQGRILVNGNWVYELGHASREGGTLNVGDYVEVSQAIGTPDPNAVLLRTDVDVVLPDELPTSPVALEWEFTARLNGTPRYTRKLGAGGRTMALRDIAVSLANSSPPDTVAFRLEVVLA